MNKRKKEKSLVFIPKYHSQISKADLKRFVQQQKVINSLIKQQTLSILSPNYSINEIIKIADNSRQQAINGALKQQQTLSILSPNYSINEIIKIADNSRQQAINGALKQQQTLSILSPNYSINEILKQQKIATDQNLLSIKQINKTEKKEADESLEDEGIEYKKLDNILPAFNARVRHKTPQPAIVINIPPEFTGTIVINKKSTTTNDTFGLAFDAFAEEKEHKDMWYVGGRSKKDEIYISIVNHLAVKWDKILGKESSYPFVLPAEEFNINEIKKLLIYLSTEIYKKYEEGLTDTARDLEVLLETRLIHAIRKHLDNTFYKELPHTKIDWFKNEAQHLVKPTEENLSNSLSNEIPTPKKRFELGEYIRDFLKQYQKENEGNLPTGSQAVKATALLDFCIKKGLCTKEGKRKKNWDIDYGSLETTSWEAWKKTVHKNTPK